MECHLKREYELQLLNNYIEIDRDEMDYVEGGIALESAVAIVARCFAIAGGIYYAGTVAGTRLYYSGFTNVQYQQYKWYIRGIVVASLGLVGATFMIGLENSYYEKVTGR